MNDLIDRHEAIRDIRLMDVCVMYDDMCSTEEAVEKAIVATKRTAIFGLECMHSAEPEQKKGKWIKPCDIIGFGRCSNCNALWDNSLIENRYFRYCPRCGADMRGEQNDTD